MKSQQCLDEEIRLVSLNNLIRLLDENVKQVRSRSSEWIRKMPTRWWNLGYRFF